MSARHGVPNGAPALVALVTVATLLGACSTTPPAPSGSPAAVTSTATPGPSDATGLGATFDPGITPPAVPFDGLYVSDQVSVSGDATVAVVRSGFGCLAMEHLVGAGEWTIVDREAASIGGGPDAATITILTLQNGADTALAWLTGGDACTARIARTTTVPITVSGAATFDGSAAMDQPLCVANGKLVTLSVAYRTPAGPNVALSVTVPARTGLARLDPDELTFGITRGPMSLAQLAASVTAGLRAGQDAFAEAYRPTDGSRLTLDVRSLNPFSGRLHLVDLEGDRGTLSLDGDVECHLPGGALDRAAEAAAAAGPTATPSTGGTPGPTLAPPPGVAVGTVVATGGGVAGTYKLPAIGLDCYYDVDAGAWTIETPGDANPIFFLYAFTGPGGGATDRASLGLIVGDGSNGRIALFDTSISPPVGTAQVTVAPSGSNLSVVLQARNPDGVSLAANLACQAS